MIPMCSNCKKRPAVVFITTMQGNEKKNEGLCLSCARERNIPQVTEYMNRMGITGDEIDQISEQMMSMLDGDSFEMGGSGLMPDFISNMFSINSDESESDSNDSAPSEKNNAKDSGNEKGGKKGIFGRKEKKKELEEGKKEGIFL